MAEVFTRSIPQAFAMRAQLAEWQIDDTVSSPSVLIVGDYEHLTAQVVIVSGAPTVIIEGHLFVPGESATFLPLPDRWGAALTFTVNGLGFLAAPVYAVRPRISLGNGSASVRILALRGGRG